jgi:F-type H+-transporting ATPase subunit b
MEQLIHAFGIDIKLITIQIVNFVVLLVALSYFLYTPILKLLRERQETIAKGIEDAEDAAKAKAHAQEEKQSVLASAQQSASEIVDRAKSQAKVKEDEILSAAQEKASAAVADALAKGEALKAKAIKDSEAEIARLAILAAEKVLKEKAL